MIKGGYQIIDLKDAALTLGGNAVTISGVYEALEGNYRKPVLLSGLHFGSVERADVWANFSVSGTNFIADVAGIGIITVTSADAVSLTKDEELAGVEVPDTDGTYTLTLTIADGVSAITWES